MTPGITTTRAAAAVWVLLVALVLQVSVLPHLAFHAVVPDVVLLVVVAVGLRYGSEPAMVLGFAGGLLLGVVEALGTHFTSPSLKMLLSYSVFIGVLLWRPNGLFAR